MSPSTRRREQLPAINRNAARDQSELPPAIIGIRNLFRKAKIIDLQILAVCPNHAQRLFNREQGDLVPDRFVFLKYVHAELSRELRFQSAFGAFYLGLKYP